MFGPVEQINNRSIHSVISTRKCINIRTLPFISRTVIPCGKIVRLAFDRGRDGALVCTAPPSEPSRRFSRTRLSGWCFAS